jgi:DNA invertase Pin-like site-specific DNA recombinase
VVAGLRGRVEEEERKEGRERLTGGVTVSAAQGKRKGGAGRWAVAGRKMMGQQAGWAERCGG